MAEQNPNARPDEQTPEQDALEKSLEELSLDELLASVKDDLARVDAMMDEPGDKGLRRPCSRFLSPTSRSITRF